MKAEEKESSSKDPTKEDENPEKNTHKSNSPQPSSSKENIVFQNSPESTDAQTKDALFEPTVDMLVNDFDEEQTLEEEEALAAKEHVDPSEELSDLQRESEMPIEELLKLYGCAPPSFTSSSGSRKRRRRREQISPAKVSKVEEVRDPTSVEEDPIQPTDSVSILPLEEITEESPDEDGATTATTNTTNYIENQSLDDDTNYDDEEPSESELKKLYTGLYERDENNGELKLDVDDEDDLDYIPDEDENKKTIMVGIEYQAIIPDSFVKYDDALPYENEDKLLWDPSKVKDDEIEDYLFKFSTAVNGGANHTSSQGTGSKHLRDDEQALLLLVQCGNNFEEALRRRRLGSVAPTNMSIWSEEECRNFENGLRLYGKSFHEIQASKVTTRSVGELVEFYYLWKKTERADIFASKARLEKKKYNNPCAKHMDLMEKYLEEYDNNGGSANRERERDARSVSPNVNSNSLLLTDTKRHRETNSGIGNNNHNQLSHSPDKLMKQIDEGAAIKSE